MTEENVQKQEETSKAAPESPEQPKAKEAPKEPAPKEKAEEYKELLQRVQADFENFRKRMEREKQQYIKFASKEIIVKLLPILDNFELALASEKKGEDFVKGIEMIYSQLYDALAQAGLKRIDAKDKPFDPHLHEALLQEESDKESGTVLEELQKGYTLQETVLRHTKVKVSK